MILLLFPTVDRVSHTYACDAYLFTASFLCKLYRSFSLFTM